MKPVAHHIENPIAHGTGSQGAAIEKDEVRIERGSSRFILKQRPVALPEGGKMAGNRRVLDIGETPFGKPGPPTALRRVLDGNRREKTVQNQFLHQIQSEGSLQSIRNELASGSHDGNRDGIRPV